MQGCASAKRLAMLAERFFFTLALIAVTISAAPRWYDRSRSNSLLLVVSHNRQYSSGISDPRKAWVYYAVNPFRELCLAAVIPRDTDGIPVIVMIYLSRPRKIGTFFIS